MIEFKSNLISVDQEEVGWKLELVGTNHNFICSLVSDIPVLVLLATVLTTDASINHANFEGALFRFANGTVRCFANYYWSLAPIPESLRW